MKTLEAVSVRARAAVGAESFFADYLPLKMEVKKFGNRVLVYAGNQGRNILLLKRMILRLGWGGGSATYLFLREGDFIVGGERIEQGLYQLKYETGSTTAVDAQVFGEYMEVAGRSQSPAISLT